mmetsp:Transcript_18802/g.46677  ORF Transcript_18802/g.46677 Transcript_18802/m.46677 type:complete len:598 (-) Transcript_18802:251-2044(-)
MESAKLGVTHESDSGDCDLSDLFLLRQENEETKVRETNRIEYGDELVLERKEIGNDDVGESAMRRMVRSSSVYGIGTIVRKKFKGKYYEGKVVSYDSINKCYHIRYTDGDEDDFDEAEMKLYYKHDQRYSHDDAMKKEDADDGDVNAHPVKEEDTDNDDANDSDIISISSDENDDSSYSDGTEVEYDSSASEVDCLGENERRCKRTKRNPKAAVESPLEVIMENRDIPSAPGKPDHRSENNERDDEMEEKSMLVAGAGKKKAEQEVKHRIIKLLNTGFHDQSNEHEAKNAMKLAQRLMRKHNLSQALLLKEREAKNSQNTEGDEVLKGGMVKVKIVNQKTGKASLFARWLSKLLNPVCENFGVKCFIQRRRGVKCEVVFYGIYSNAQLAGYAFKVAAERIAQMMVEYHPKRGWNSASTKSSRLSYAIGIADGIKEEVQRNLDMEEEQRKRKLERARLAGSRGEAYAESDEENFGIDSEGPGISLVKEENPVNNVASRNSLPPNNDCSQSRSISGIDLQNRVEELEKEEQAALVLVDHNKKVAEEVLKEHDIKLSSGRKRKPIQFDRHSYDRGVEDSKEIDINQRAIREEVNVKVEKS